MHSKLLSYTHRSHPIHLKENQNQILLFFFFLSFFLFVMILVMTALVPVYEFRCHRRDRLIPI
jgi:cytochrome c oxidase assembly protein Cox11